MTWYAKFKLPDEPPRPGQRGYFSLAHHIPDSPAILMQINPKLGIVVALCP